jgi:hypothetical protein
MPVAIGNMSHYVAYESAFRQASVRRRLEQIENVALARAVLLWKSVMARARAATSAPGGRISFEQL